MDRTPHSRLGLALLLPPLLLAGGSPAQGEESEDYRGLPPMDLPMVLDRARAFSPQLRASGERITQARAQVRMAYTLLLPFVSVSGTYALADREVSLDFGGFDELYALAAMNCAGWDEGTMGPLPGLCATPPAEEAAAPSGGSTSSRRVIQSRHNWEGSLTVGISLLNARTIPQLRNVYTARDLAELQDRFTEEALLFSVALLFYGVATAQAAVDLMEENLAIVGSGEALLAAREAAQVALPNERLRFDMARVQAEDGLEVARLGLRHARRALALLMGNEDSGFRAVAGEITAPGALTAPDDAALARRLDVRIGEGLVEMAEREVLDIWMQMVPTLTALWVGSATSTTGFSGEHLSWRAMVSLEWNLFSGGIHFAQADAARARVREARHNRDAALLQARVEVEDARAGVLDARRGLRTGERMEALAGDNRALVAKQYELGVADQTLLLDADRELLTARIQRIQARLRLTVAALAWSRALGHFLDDVQAGE
ncbi:MAG: TolC family protein [Deltaproteobacteria bacterium]|nr:TolC family protein [Deltaproteobacteria bacterium]